MILGDIIKQYRKDNNLSMDDFSKKSGLSKAYISMLEKNINTVNNKPIIPSLETIKAVSMAVGMDFNDVIAMLDGNQKVSLSKIQNKLRGVKIPVLGRVAAGIPIEAIEDIIDYEEITEDMARTGDFFGLQIQGDSMEPRITEGDVVIVRKQPDIISGQVAIVLINGQDATCKKVVKHENGLSLISFNPTYSPKFYTDKEVMDLPINIVGKVVELRGKFE
ncbi:MAG: LexA family protein [Bacillota bacterium]